MERNVDIVNELREISLLVAGVGAANAFAVPQGYFESAPDTIMAGIKDEMTAGKDVPAGYFDELPRNILVKIEGTAANELAEISPLLAGIKKVNPFQAPANYFEQAPSDAMAIVGEEKIPDVLKHINKLQPYQVPAGYFDSVAANIVSKAKEKSGAKLIAMPGRRFDVMKYAAAAVFTGMVALGVYNYAGKMTDNKIDAPVAMDDKKFEETLNSLGEEEIIRYLEKNGNETDVASLASGVDENALPSQEEYFTDEEALDNFLEDINTNN